MLLKDVVTLFEQFVPSGFRLKHIAKDIQLGLRLLQLMLKVYQVVLTVFFNLLTLILAVPQFLLQYFYLIFSFYCLLDHIVQFLLDQFMLFFPSFLLFLNSVHQGVVKLFLAVEALCQRYNLLGLQLNLLKKYRFLLEIFIFGCILTLSVRLHNKYDKAT